MPFDQKYSIRVLSKEMPRPIWYWKSNQNSNIEWKAYSDIENEIIEEAFINNEPQVTLDKYIIDLKNYIQINKFDNQKQRPIKRGAIEKGTIDCLRQERFSLPIQLCDPFVDLMTDDHNFLEQLYKTKYKDAGVNAFYSPDGKSSVSGLFESAAQGILVEGEKLGQNSEAQWIAKQLRSLIPKDILDDRKEIGRCIISLYTRECFLYKLVNKALREDDLTKIDTLGPYVRLLNHSIGSVERCFGGLVYRGAYLEPEQIEKYKEGLGTKKRWPAFASTSKNRALAEIFGNTLFIIHICYPRKPDFYHAYDIQIYSSFPDEEEILINYGFFFLIEKIECDEHGKHIIYLKSLQIGDE